MGKKEKNIPWHPTGPSPEPDPVLSRPRSTVACAVRCGQCSTVQQDMGPEHVHTCPHKRTPYSPVPLLDCGPDVHRQGWLTCEIASYGTMPQNGITSSMSRDAGHSSSVRELGPWRRQASALLSWMPYGMEEGEGGGESSQTGAQKLHHVASFSCPLIRPRGKAKKDQTAMGPKARTVLTHNSLVIKQST